MTAADSYAVQLLGVSHRYTPDTPVLSNVELEIPVGERVALLGESGAGKSTLLRCINALVTPTVGEVVVLGQPVRELSERERQALRRQVGMIFQQFHLHERLSVMANVLTGRLGYLNTAAGCLRRFAADDRALALDCIRQVGLEAFAHRRVRNLSGGQKQRVGIARALAQQPRIILGDEPTANIDLRTAREIMELLRTINERQGTTLLLALHDVVLAREFCTRVVGLRAGRVVFEGSGAEVDGAVVERIFY